MKIRKLAGQQLDFLATDQDRIQWNQCDSPTREQTEHLLSQLMLSALCQIAHPKQEDCDVQN
jgi:hypothetical protein